MNSQRRLLVPSCAVNLSRRLTFGIFILALACIATPAHAINKTWVANSSGNWSTSGAWSPSGAPNGGEFDVIIDDGSHSVVVTQNGDITINSLTLGSNDTLVIEGTFSSTSLTSDEGITNNGTIRLMGFSAPSERLTITSGALTNTATGWLDFPSGSGDPFFAADLINNGTVTVDHNVTFDKLNCTYTNNAQFSVLLSRTLSINADGTLNQNGGTFVLDGTVNPGIGEFTVSGGILNVGASGRVIGGDFKYLGGTISNPLTLQNTTLTIGPAATNAATFHMSGNNTLASNVNAGQTITVQSGFDSVTLTSADGFTNNGTIRLLSESAPSPFLTVEDGTITNSATGLLDFDAGGGDAIFTSELLNNGTVTVDQDSTFNKLNATYTNNGQFSIADDKTLTVINGGILEHEAGTFTLNGELDISGSTFNMNGGTLNFGGTALIDNGNFNYVDGTVNGTVKLRNTTFTIGPGADATTFLLTDNNTLASDVGAGHTINVQSTNVGAVTLTSNSSFTNAGTLDVQSTSGTSPFLYLPTEADDTVTNTGTLRFQSSSSAAPVFTGRLVNNGLVEVDNDTVFNKLNSTYANNGQFNVDSGATLTVSNGGTLDQDGGTFTLDGELEMFGNTFNMNAGVMNFAAAALIDNGNFNYLGGTINGDVKLRNTTFTIGAGTTPETFQLNYDNTLASDVGAGHTINVEAGTNAITLQSNAGFTNAGTINIKSSDASAFLYLPTEANDTMTNTGTLRFQSSGSGDSIFTGRLVNSGIVEVENDTTFNKLNATYANNGQLIVESGVTLTVSNGGTLDQDAGTFTLDGELEMFGNTFNMNGGVMNFAAAALIDNGNFNYLGGTINGDVKLRNTTFTIGAGTNPETFQLNYDNTLASDVGAGHTINVEAGTNAITLQSDTSFTNAGTINIKSSNASTFLYLPTEANDTVTNTGTLRFQSSGSGGSVFTGSLVNSGTLEVKNDTVFNKLNSTYTNNGQIIVDSGATLHVINGGSFTNFAANTLTGGSYDIAGLFIFTEGEIYTNQAEVILRGPSSQILRQASGDALANLATNGAAGKLRLLEGRDFLTQGASFTNQGLLELDGSTFAFLQLFGTTFNNTSTGQITGEGTIQGNSSVHVSNAGVVAPGTATAAGILNFNGPYTQASTGSLAINIFGNDNSDPQNLEFDVLSLGGSASLNGSLSVALGNFTPDGDDQFTIFDAGSLSGQFSNALHGQRLSTLDGAGSFLVNYNVGGGNVTLSDFRLSGDFNFDGVVDAADYVMWRKVINTPASYTAWRTNFGESTLSGAGGGQGDNDRGAAPEPSAIALAAIALVLGGLRRGR